MCQCECALVRVMYCFVWVSLFIDFLLPLCSVGVFRYQLAQTLAYTAIEGDGNGAISAAGTLLLENTEITTTTTTTNSSNQIKIINAVRRDDGPATICSIRIYANRVAWSVSISAFYIAVRCIRVGAVESHERLLRNCTTWNEVLDFVTKFICACEYAREEENNHRSIVVVIIIIVIFIIQMTFARMLPFSSSNSTSKLYKLENIHIFKQSKYQLHVAMNQKTCRYSYVVHVECVLCEFHVVAVVAVRQSWGKWIITLYWCE